jgi:hypothetical protein
MSVYNDGAMSGVTRIRHDVTFPLRLMHDGISFDKILLKQVGYFETPLKIENSFTTLAAPHHSVV